MSAWSEKTGSTITSSYTEMWPLLKRSYNASFSVEVTFHLVLAREGKSYWPGRLTYWQCTWPWDFSFWSRVLCLCCLSADAALFGCSGGTSSGNSLLVFVTEESWTRRADGTPCPPRLRGGTAIDEIRPRGRRSAQHERDGFARNMQTWLHDRKQCW